MRFYHVAVLLGIMVAAVPLIKARADTDVLVPTDTPGGSGGNLGLVPGGTSSPNKSSSGTTIPNYPSYANTPTAPSAPYDPLATSTSPTLISSPEQALESLKSAVASEREQMKTTIVHHPNMTAVLKNEDSLPNSIDVSVAPNKMSAYDMELITQQLGIKDAATLAACKLSATGYIRTDKSAMSVFDLGSEDHATAKYDGKINEVIAMVHALCDSTQPLPADKNMVVKIGDKYSASLGSTRCKVPANVDPHKISITIPETGSPQCQIG